MKTPKDLRRFAQSAGLILEVEHARADGGSKVTSYRYRGLGPEYEPIVSINTPSAQVSKDMFFAAATAYKAATDAALAKRGRRS